MKSNMIYY